jgi:hypothetical protein
MFGGVSKSWEDSNESVRWSLRISGNPNFTRGVGVVDSIQIVMLLNTTLTWVQYHAHFD